MKGDTVLNEDNFTTNAQTFETTQTRGTLEYDTSNNLKM